MFKRVAFMAGLALAGAAAPVLANDMVEMPGHKTVQQQLADAIASPARFFDRRRDKWRHPAQTLEFFRVEPGMTVVDYMPAKGWYTRVLVPYLGEQGRYVGVHPAPNGPKKVSDYFAGQHRSFSAEVGQWSMAGAPISALSSGEMAKTMPGSVDRVLIFREMHNLHGTRILDDELAAIHAALKTDGMLGIVQHRAPASASKSWANGENGYMRQADVIALVEKAGFRLVAASEINANAADPANHKGGVWALPPVWRSADKTMQAIGESDRMTLLFAKR
jgi:predicted methyltransferase